MGRQNVKSANKGCNSDEFQQFTRGNRKRCQRENNERNRSISRQLQKSRAVVLRCPSRRHQTNSRRCRHRWQCQQWDVL